MAVAPTKVEVIDAIVRRLVGRGYENYRKGWVDLAISPDFRAWVGLNRAVVNGVTLVNPFVGVHAPNLMRLCSSLSGFPYDRGTATLAVHLGELAPDERVFDFSDSALLDQEAGRLAQLCHGPGLAFSKSIASYAALAPRLYERMGMLGGYPERYACCLALQGLEDEALNYVVAAAAKEPDYLADFARSFAGRFGERSRS